MSSPPRPGLGTASWRDGHRRPCAPHRRSSSPGSGSTGRSTPTAPGSSAPAATTAWTTSASWTATRARRPAGRRGPGAPWWNSTPTRSTRAPSRKQVQRRLLDRLRRGLSRDRGRRSRRRPARMARGLPPLPGRRLRPAAHRADPAPSRDAGRRPGPLRPARRPDGARRDHGFPGGQRAPRRLGSPGPGAVDRARGPAAPGSCGHSAGPGRAALTAQPGNRPVLRSAHRRSA